MSTLPVNLTWGEVYDLNCYYRRQMQHCAELANTMPKEFPDLKSDMLRYADEAADSLHKWDAHRETFYRYAIRPDEGIAA